MRSARHLAVLLVASSALSGCWWGQTGFGPGRTYDNPHETTITADTVDGLELLWSTNQPILGAGTLFAANGRVLLVDGPRAVALDAGTGEVEWESTLPESGATAYGEPAVRDGVVLRPHYSEHQECPGPIGCRWFSDGMVSAHSTATGAEVPDRSIGLWPADSLDGPDGPFALGGAHAVMQARFPYRVMAYDLDSGAHAYGPAGDGPLAAVSFDEASGLVVAVRPDPENPSSVWLDALSLTSTGGVPQLTPLWSEAVPAVSTDLPRPTVVGGRVYVTSSKDLRVLDAATGAPVWGTDAVGYIEQIAVRGDTVFAAASGVLKAFTDCGGPACAPVWSGVVRGRIPNIVVAGDLVHVQSEGRLFDTRMDAYPVDGCGAAVCSPLHTFTIPAAPYDMIVSGGQLLVVAVPFDPEGDRVFAFGVPDS